MAASNWNEIVYANVAGVTNAALRVLGSVEEAEDVAQEVFLEAYRKWDSTADHAWPGLLKRMAVCRALDVIRNKRQTSSLDFHPVDLRELEPSDHIQKQERHDQLRIAVAKLSGRESEVFCLACFELFSHEEIAASLGLTRGAVATLLSKAKSKLAEIVQRIPGENR